MTPHAIRRFLASHNMRVIPKSQSRLMRLIGFLLRVLHINATFCERSTTMIWRHIYYPSSWGTFDLQNDADVRARRVTFEHEFVHTKQREKWWLFWAVSYLALPLPILLAWFRWRWEREAYLVNLRNGRSIEWCVEKLWQGYGWPWPRKWMAAWFEANKPGRLP